MILLSLKHEIATIVHSWHDDCFTSIDTCRVWGAKAKGSSLQKEVSHTYTLRLS